MNETLSWTLGGVVAGLALLSLAATGAQRDPHSRPVLLATLSAETVSPADVKLPGAILAEAYFDLAKDSSGPGFDDWFIRHELTVKGVAAKRGDNPLPEDAEEHPFASADAPKLARAEQIVRGWRARFATIGDAKTRARLARLTAALQVRYDRWLLLSEAGAPSASLLKARAAYEGIETALETAAHQVRVAAL